MCNRTGVILFPCHKRWLKGEEYGFLIRHYYAYSEVLRLHQLSEKFHPHLVYEKPKRKSRRNKNKFIKTALNFHSYRRCALLHPGTPLARLRLP